MSSYRLLTLQELELLKDDFVRFLAVQGISGDNWLLWQKENPKKCEIYIEQFSEYIFIQILEKVEIMARFAAGERQYIQFEDGSMTFVSIKGPASQHKNQVIELKDCDVVKGNKKLFHDVHDEKFKWLKQGFAPLEKDNIRAVQDLLKALKDV